MGGLSIGESRSGGREAPGLKLKAGSAIDPRDRSVSSAGRRGDELWVSMAEKGRRPVALEKVGGAEEGASTRMGNVNVGFGGGPSPCCED